MKFVVDENIPFGESAFATVGQVRLIPGRAITRQDLRDADALVCRSVTRVGPDLLEGTSVRFVATATIGADHVNIDWLKSAGMGFSSAPGSNANSVAEYIMAALLVLSVRRGERLDGRTLAVVGCGNVGSRVAAKAQALGLQVIQNDPPLERFTGDPAYAPLDSVFGADFVTLHVPLVREGPDVTRHLVDRAFLRRIGRGATLLNSSRGEVVDAAALAEALESGAVRDAVLDVWEGEPDISHDLVRLVALATPHIAGYSFDGKLQGTAMVYRAACAFFGLEPRWRLADVEVPTPVPRLSLTASGRRHEEALLEAVKSLYDIEADDANLRAAGSLPLSARGKRFDELRKTYPTRREFQHTVVDCPDVPPRLMAKLRGLGFRTEPP